MSYEGWIFLLGVLVGMGSIVVGEGVCLSQPPVMKAGLGDHPDYFHYRRLTETYTLTYNAHPYPLPRR